MDIRDMMFWCREAEIKRIKEQLNMIYAVRLGFAEEVAYSSNIALLENQLNILEGKQQNIIRENWKDLKSIGRR
jgi:hypothetical protein